MIEFVCEPLFAVGKETFPITVDYGQNTGTALHNAHRHVRSHGTIDLEGRSFPEASTGKRDFICRYATLREDNDLWELEKIFADLRLHPADMMQFFAFVCMHARTEVTPEKPRPVVAAALGSTWKCSHDILLEMAGVHWDPWYHGPGRSLGTTSESPQGGFSKGTRFLIVQ